uniref:Uncharacterized protein n=1 Tax=Anguilla anguilla TaxID=7936 RepID=A0A0E9R3T0_ANGAN
MLCFQIIDISMGGGPCACFSIIFKYHVCFLYIFSRCSQNTVYLQHLDT